MQPTLLYQQLTQSLATHYDQGEARAIARLYIEESLGLCYTDILTDKPLFLTAEQSARWEHDLQRLAQGVPVQYVLGYAHFMGHRFRVDTSVLIPRPETEGLVQWACERAGTAPIRMLDAGTGSGCIAVSLAQALSSSRVWAWDISEAALALAQTNAQQLGANITFAQRDIIAQAQRPDDAAQSLDLLVSNPPYIREKEMAEMERHVLDHEPHLALFVPDYDPLLFYRALAQLGQHLLVSGGSLLVECHRDCVNHVADLFALLGYTQVETRLDCFEAPRFVAAVKP